MSAKPLVGAPITAVYRTGKTSHTTIGEVIEIDDGTCLRVRTQDPIGLFQRTVVPRRYDREGRTWIRGHHAPESEEAQALLAAWILTRESR